MRNLFLVIFLISRIIYGENTKGRAWAKVEVLNKKIIIGEPIYIKLTKYATPYAGDIYLDGKKCDDPYIKGIEEKSSIFSSKYHLFNKINDSKKMKVEEEVKEQSFNILNNCDLMMKDMEEREYEVCYKDEWISACDRFSIEYPKGKDLEVFEKMGKEARDFTFPESRITTNEILENYPTSTYAGWVPPSHGFDLARLSGKRLIDDLTKSEEERKKDGVVVYSEEARRFIQFAEKFTYANKDHINIGIIYMWKALAHMVLYQWEEAYEAAKKSLEYEWPLWYYSAHPPTLDIQRKAIEDSIKEMEKRKLVKKKD